MSTVKHPLKYRWIAVFDDMHIIYQPEDDQYSKHDPKAEHNPSSFRDLLDHMEKSPLDTFSLGDDYAVHIPSGTFTVGDLQFSLESEPLVDRKLIYYRVVNRDIIGGEWQDAIIKEYVFGYEGKNSQGKVEKKVLHIDG